MGRYVLIVAVLGACSFRAGASGDASGGVIDMPVVDDAPAEMSVDGSTSGICGGRVWAADFSSDPTTQDLNHDNVDDFVMRDGNPLPGVLIGGAWILPTQAAALDTRPLQNFTTRVVAHVRMRNTSLPTSHGAILWLNVNYNGTTFTPMFVDIALQPVPPAGMLTQTAVLFTKAVDGSEVPGVSVPGLDSGMHDFTLDIDPVAAHARFVVDGVDHGEQPLTPDPLGGNDDRFATVQAYGGAAEFDELRLEVCP